jgi:hypothetical protein
MARSKAQRDGLTGRGLDSLRRVRDEFDRCLASVPFNVTIENAGRASLNAYAAFKAASDQAFTSQQRNELDAHLADVIGSDTDRHRAIFIIGVQFFAARGYAKNPKLQHKWNNYTVKHFTKVSNQAMELRQSLAKRRPDLGLAGLDWSALDQMLSAVEASAHSMASSVRSVKAPPSNRGRRPEEWRDELIALVYGLYPPGKAVKTTGSHFESTVGMLLEWVGRDVEDLHGLVIDALQRRPRSYVLDAVSAAIPADVA